MKKVLSLLLAYTLVQAQTWALSGGPQFFGSGLGASVIGTYAGVLVPSTVNRIFDNPATIPSAASDANSLGIFILGVPDTGVASGNFLFFQEGEAFFGDIQGVVDPENGSFRALVAGAASTNNLGGGAEFLSPLSAVGKIEGEITPGGGIGSLVRLQGTAFFQLQGFVPDSSPNGFGFATLRELTFEVDGFKQSDQVTLPTITPPNTVSVDPPGGNQN